jgi:Predicted permease.
MVNWKAPLKLISVIILTFGAVFICTIFLNYSIDLKGVAHLFDDPQTKIIYEAQLTQSKVIMATAGGILGAVTLLVLIFSIGQFINESSAELGVLKALGYSENRIAFDFAKFGLSVFIASGSAYFAAVAASPVFYNYLSGNEFPALKFGLNIQTPLILIIAPTVLFSVFSVFYAVLRLRKTPLDLIIGAKKIKVNKLTQWLQAKERVSPFLIELKRNILFGNLILIFFVGFAAFGFGAQIQMAFTMKSIQDGWLMPVVFIAFGIIMGLVTLLLALTFVINKNKKYLAMLKAYGYTDGECNKAIFGGYRVVTYIGFAMGTVYQFFLIKSMASLFAGAFDIPEVRFSLLGFLLRSLFFLSPTN